MAMNGGDYAILLVTFIAYTIVAEKHGPSEGWVKIRNPA
jgi:hypothetical protein